MTNQTKRGIFHSLDLLGTVLTDKGQMLRVLFVKTNVQSFLYVNHEIRKIIVNRRLICGILFCHKVKAIKYKMKKNCQPPVIISRGLVWHQIDCDSFFSRILSFQNHITEKVFTLYVRLNYFNETVFSLCHNFQHLEVDFCNFVKKVPKLISMSF